MHTKLFQLYLNITIKMEKQRKNTNPILLDIVFNKLLSNIKHDLSNEKTMAVTKTKTKAKTNWKTKTKGFQVFSCTPLLCQLEQLRNAPSRVKYEDLSIDLSIEYFSWFRITCRPWPAFGRPGQGGSSGHRHFKRVHTLLTPRKKTLL